MKMQVTKEFQIQLGLRIRQARKAVSLTQEQLADKLDLYLQYTSLFLATLSEAHSEFHNDPVK